MLRLRLMHLLYLLLLLLSFLAQILNHTFSADLAPILINRLVYSQRAVDRGLVLGLTKTFE